MGERTWEVKVFKTDYICEKCGEGVMHFISAYGGSPPMYQHQCVACGHRDDLLAEYPSFEYRPAEEPTPEAAEADD
jgi:hypothetical protein